MVMANIMLYCYYTFTYKNRLVMRAEFGKIYLKITFSWSGSPRIRLKKLMLFGMKVVLLVASIGQSMRKVSTSEFQSNMG